jgi:hypothetical protein
LQLQAFASVNTLVSAQCKRQKIEALGRIGESDSIGGKPNFYGEK